MNQAVKEFGKKLIGKIPTKLWLSLYFRARLGYSMDWKNPQSLNQKYQWLKVYDKNPAYTDMVDKYEVKKYIAEKLGAEYVIPTLGVWDSFDDIDFDELPEQFVLKCTHDSGGVLVVKDKSKLDCEKARLMFSRALKRSPYSVTREWPYKNVRPRIIAETYLELDEAGGQEFKLFCNYGQVRWVFVSAGKAHTTGCGGRTNDGYDLNFEHLPVSFTYPNADIMIDKPKQWDELVSLAETISRDIPILRFDTYVVDNRIYFGEMTFFHASGMCDFRPREWDMKFGAMFDIAPAMNNKKK